jgi:hypothetical protein
MSGDGECVMGEPKRYIIAWHSNTGMHSHARTQDDDTHTGIHTCAHANTQAQTRADTHITDRQTDSRTHARKATQTQHSCSPWAAFRSHGAHA